MNKDILAKLMATENLLVEHQPVNTASFDVQKRLLTLPLYSENLGEDVVDLFVTHEISHALYTPIVEHFGKLVTDKPELLETAHDVLNIVEDIRIEKRIKTKFPGARKSFVTGYKKLLEGDFFATKGKDVNSFNFLDRINLYFKCGINSGIIFTNPEEKEIVNKLEHIKTWEEVIQYSKILLQYAEKSNNEKKKRILSEGSLTQEAFDKAISKECNTKQAKQDYKNLPIVSDKQLKTIVRPYKRILDDFKNVNGKTVGLILNTLKKESNFLCNQFERYKAANTYEKTRFAKNGILNPTKLFKYKYSEDIFITNEIKPIGKNHGLIILIDFSGSMCNCIKNVILQVFSILQFCKRQNIPFEVYGFTFRFNKTGKFPWSGMGYTKNVEISDVNTVCQFLSSNMTLSEYNKGLEILLKIGKEEYDATALGYKMSGTPLNHALMTMNTIIKKFKEKYPIDIMNFLTITDGAAGDVIDSNIVIRNLETRKVYNDKNKTQAFLNFLKDTYHMKSLGFYIGSADKISMAMACGNNIDIKQYSVHKTNIAKTGFTTLTSSGYDEFYYVDQNTFKQHSRNIESEHIEDVNELNEILVSNNAIFKKKTLFLAKFIESFARSL